MSGRRSIREKWMDLSFFRHNDWGKVQRDSHNDLVSSYPFLTHSHTPIFSLSLSLSLPLSHSFKQNQNLESSRLPNRNQILNTFESLIINMFGRFCILIFFNRWLHHITCSLYGDLFIFLLNKFGIFFFECIELL
jgi:hypothetical protein